MESAKEPPPDIVQPAGASRSLSDLVIVEDQEFSEDNSSNNSDVQILLVEEKEPPPESIQSAGASRSLSDIVLVEDQEFTEDNSASNADVRTEKPPTDSVEPAKTSRSLSSDIVLVEDQEFLEDNSASNAVVQILPADEGQPGQPENIQEKRKRTRGKKKKAQAAVENDSLQDVSDSEEEKDTSLPMKILPAVDEAALQEVSDSEEEKDTSPPMKILPAVDESGNILQPLDKKSLRKQMREQQKERKRLGILAGKEQQTKANKAEMEAELRRQVLACDGFFNGANSFTGLTRKERNTVIKATLKEKNAANLVNSPPITDVRDLLPEDIDSDKQTDMKWPLEKRWAILNKLRGIPEEQLTLQLCHRMADLANTVNVRLDSWILAKRTQFSRETKAAQMTLLNPPPVTDVNDIQPGELDDVTLKKLPDNGKMAVLNKLRGIPLSQMTRHHCHMVWWLYTALKLPMDKVIDKRRKELIMEKKVAKQMNLLAADSTAPVFPVIQPVPVPVPAPVDPAVAAATAAAALKQIQKAKFDHIKDFKTDCKEYKKWAAQKKWNLFNALKAIPLEELNREACHKMSILSSYLKAPLSAEFHRRRQELMKKNNGQPVVTAPSSNPLPVLGAQPNYHDFKGSQRQRFEPSGIMQPQFFDSRNHLPSLINPVAFSYPTPSGPYGDFHGQFQQPSVPWGGYPPTMEQPPMQQMYPQPDYAQQEWMHQQQIQEQERIRQQQIQEQMQQQLQMQQQESSRKRGQERTRRSPSPKRMREAPPSLAPPEVKLPLIDMANYENYYLEEPVVKSQIVYRQPSTVQEMQAISDLVSLCQSRDAPAVTKAYLHPASRVILDRICDYLGEGYKLQEELTSKSISYKSATSVHNERIRYQTNVWIGGVSRIITLGEGVDVEQGQATKNAYASAMSALCYMMVIPYQLFQVILKCGPDYIDLILHTCKTRIRHMIAVSREAMFGPLASYQGGLEAPSYDIKNIWTIFINRMRHSGVETWESYNVVTVPRNLSPFSGRDIDDFFFKCERDDRYVISWTGMAPIRGEVVTFDEADFQRTSACSRFQISPAEKGIIPAYLLAGNSMDFPSSEAYCHHLRHKHPQMNPKEYDPVVHMPFRDLICSHGIGSRSIPMLTPFLLKYIGSRWNRSLIVKHEMEIEVKDGKERWKHIVSLSFDGVPFIFLGGRCRRDTFSSALLHAGAVIAEQFANMMIIPRELCYFLEKQGRTWAAVVIYVCRERFAAFEALVRNPMYSSLHGIASATLDFTNPLYKLSESFFWRMRVTGFSYWVDHGKRLMVPRSFGHKPQLAVDAFFSFESTYDSPNWEAINAAPDRVDNFDMSTLKVEDRMWTVWEGGNRMEEEEKTITPEPPMPDLGPVAMTPGMMFENALKSDYQIPLAALSVAECKVVLNLLRSLAASCKKKGLELKTTREFSSMGRQHFRCDIAWSGNLSWILNASFESDLERDLQFGAAWTLYKMLIRMAIVPPGLFKFVGNSETRLPYVVASISPFLHLLEQLLPQFKNHPDAMNNHGLLMEQMRQLALTEWQYRAIQLPPHLVPCSEEQNRLPFVRVEAMSPRTQENWKARGDSQKYEKMARVVDERGRDVAKLASKPQPGIKFNPRFTWKPKGPETSSSQGLPTSLQKPTPSPQKAQPVPAPAAHQQLLAKQAEEEEDYDFDDELRQLEELCNAPSAPRPADAPSSSYFNYAGDADCGENEYL